MPMMPCAPAAAVLSAICSSCSNATDRLEPAPSVIQDPDCATSRAAVHEKNTLVPASRRSTTVVWADPAYAIQAWLVLQRPVRLEDGRGADSKPRHLLPHRQRQGRCRRWRAAGGIRRQPVSVPSNWMIYFQVADRDGMIAKVRVAGRPCVRRARDDDGDRRFAVFVGRAGRGLRDRPIARGAESQARAEGEPGADGGRRRRRWRTNTAARKPASREKAAPKALGAESQGRGEGVEAREEGRQGQQRPVKPKKSGRSPRARAARNSQVRGGLSRPSQGRPKLFLSIQSCSLHTVARTESQGCRSGPALEVTEGGAWAGL